MRQKFLLPALMCGNVLEYFDFFIFAHFSFLLAPLFYPPVNPIHDTIISGFFFAVGFLARPIGGYIFGYMADQQGRKKSLMLSVLGMAVPTLCIGLLPTYEQVGIIAPALLILCRIIQGMCMGGEFTNGGVLLIESYGWQKAGTVAGLYNAAAGTGSLLAIGCVAICSMPGMPDWAWRVPFVGAAALGVFSYYLRRYVSESPVFYREQFKEEASNLSILEKKHKKYVYRAIIVGGVAGVFIWIPLSYTSFFMTKIMKLPLQDAIQMTVYAVIGHNILTAIAGWISDKIGWRKMILGACAVQLILLYPAFIFLKLQAYMAFQTLMIIPAAMAYSVVHPLSAYDVPPLLRGRLSGFAFSAGLSTFAGITPLVTGTLTQFLNGKLFGVIIYIGIFAIFGFISLHYLLRDRKPVKREARLTMAA